MKAWLEAAARPDILSMKPYASARSCGTLDEDALLLDANESPWSGLKGALNRYPEPKSAKLVETLASLYQSSPDNIFLGRGSDEAIDCLLRCFCEAGQSSIVTLSPSYGVYETAAVIQGARILKVALAEGDGFEVSAERVVAAAETDTRLIFLCSPNNPTGRTISEKTIRAVCTAFSGKAIVVLDEAYVEFSSTPSLSSEAGKIENLVVLRTLSKAWGLAGLRVGAAIAFPEIIELLDRVRAPYPLARPVLDQALEALLKTSEMKERVSRIQKERKRLSEAFGALDVIDRVFESDANFLLLGLSEIDSAEFATRLRKDGIVVRDKDPYLRVSIGSEAENDRLLSAFEKVGGALCAK